MATAANPVVTLNGLIEATLDNALYYGTVCARPTIDLRFHSSCAQIVDHLKAIAGALQEEVRRLGGEPTTAAASSDQDVSSPANPAYLEGHDPALEEADQREGHLQTLFGAALADSSLPSVTRDVLTRAFATIKSDCILAHSMNRGPSYGAGPLGLV